MMMKANSRISANKVSANGFLDWVTEFRNKVGKATRYTNSCDNVGQNDGGEEAKVEKEK